MGLSNNTCLYTVYFGVFTAIYVAFNQEIDLVSTDYYAQELKFQNVIDGKNNLASLPTPVKIVENETAFELQLPNEFTEKYKRRSMVLLPHKCQTR